MLTGKDVFALLQMHEGIPEQSFHDPEGGHIAEEAFLCSLLLRADLLIYQQQALWGKDGNHEFETEKN